MADEMTDETKPKRGRPPKSEPETCEVLVMAPNIWWDGTKHETRARFSMPKAAAEEILAGDREAGRDERLIIL